MGRKMLLVKIVLDTGFAWRKPIVLIQIKLPCVSVCSPYEILLDFLSSSKINILKLFPWKSWSIQTFFEELS